MDGMVQIAFNEGNLMDNIHEGDHITIGRTWTDKGVERSEDIAFEVHGVHSSHGTYVTDANGDSYNLDNWKVKALLRPIVQLPDSAGIWVDNRGVEWLVSCNLSAIKWTMFLKHGYKWFSVHPYMPEVYRQFAPFTKVDWEPSATQALQNAYKRVESLLMPYRYKAIVLAELDAEMRGNQC